MNADHKGTMKSKRGEKKKQSSTHTPADDLLFTTICNSKKRRFLAAFASCGQIRAASKIARISWASHYGWLKDEDSAAYIEAFNHAREIAGDIAEGEIYRRAFLGFDHPVIYEGKITTTYKNYSDSLAMFWLKGLKPERYRENLNLSGSVGLPVDDFYNKIAERQRGESKP
jgi:hypothetical protein